MVDKKLASNPFFFFSISHYRWLQGKNRGKNTLTNAGCFVNNDEYDEGLWLDWWWIWCKLLWPQGNNKYIHIQHSDCQSDYCLALNCISDQSMTFLLSITPQYVANLYAYLVGEKRKSPSITTEGAWVM